MRVYPSWCYYINEECLIFTERFNVINTVQTNKKYKRLNKITMKKNNVLSCSFQVVIFFFGPRMLSCLSFIVSVFKISVELSTCMGIAWWEEAKLTLKEKTNKEM